MDKTSLGTSRTGEKLCCENVKLSLLKGRHEVNRNELILQSRKFHAFMIFHSYLHLKKQRF